MSKIKSVPKFLKTKHSKIKRVIEIKKIANGNPMLKMFTQNIYNKKVNQKLCKTTTLQHSNQNRKCIWNIELSFLYKI